MSDIPSIQKHAAVQTLLNAPDVSDWLKALVASGCERDPLDVLKDLERGLIVFSAVVDDLLEAHRLTSAPRHNV